MKARARPVRAKRASGTLTSSQGQSVQEKVRFHRRRYVMLPGWFQPVRLKSLGVPISNHHSARASMAERTEAFQGPDRNHDCPPAGSGQNAQVPSSRPATSRSGQHTRRHIRCRSACAGSGRPPAVTPGSAPTYRWSAAHRRCGGGPACQAAARAARASSIAATAASKASSVDACRGG